MSKDEILRMLEQMHHETMDAATTLNRLIAKVHETRIQGSKNPPINPPVPPRDEEITILWAEYGQQVGNLVQRMPTAGLELGALIANPGQASNRVA